MIVSEEDKNCEINSEKASFLFKAQEFVKKHDKIYVDGLSYLDDFFDYGGNAWDMQLVRTRVKKFCKLIKPHNITIKVFLEAGYGHNDREKKKYMVRETENIVNVA